MMRWLLRTFLALGLLALASPAGATISTTTVAQTFSGNGASTVFTFSFVADQCSDLIVTYTDTNNNVTTLATSTYTCTLTAKVAPNLWAVGGTITYPLSGSPIASNTTLTVTRSLAYKQLTSLSNQAYLQSAIEMALDYLTMLAQQVDSALVSISSPQAANCFFGGPSSGAAAVPTCRSLVATDLPGGPSNQFNIGNNHFVTGATSPTLTSCGTSPAIVGDDKAGQVTMGTGSPTGCTITFHTAYVSTPLCVVTWQATPLASQSYALTNAAITLTQTGTSSNKVNYLCFAQSGG